MDSILIANELVDDTKRNKKDMVLFKVDFEKAYDSVSWNFLDYMMSRMGFNQLWRKWIRKCLQTASVSVLINKSPTKEFQVGKGLR